MLTEVALRTMKSFLNDRLSFLLRVFVGFSALVLVSSTGNRASASCGDYLIHGSQARESRHLATDDDAEEPVPRRSSCSGSHCPGQFKSIPLASTRIEGPCASLLQSCEAAVLDWHPPQTFDFARESSYTTVFLTRVFRPPIAIG